MNKPVSIGHFLLYLHGDPRVTALYLHMTLASKHDALLHITLRNICSNRKCIVNGCNNTLLHVSNSVGRYMYGRSL